ncbi:MAG: hypothetical protein ACI8XO_001053 [Verrucomicrobiales bacterium]|jgi:hypothetical protein
MNVAGAPRLFEKSRQSERGRWWRKAGTANRCGSCELVFGSGMISQRDGFLNGARAGTGRSSLVTEGARDPATKHE